MGRNKKTAIYFLVFALTVYASALGVKGYLHSGLSGAHGLPDTIGSWKGMNIACDMDFLKSSLGASDIVFRAYRDGLTVVTLYMAYYKDIDSANKVHAPAVCYSGQGWKIARDEIVSRTVGQKEARINRLVVEKSRHRELVYTWWQTGERIIPRNSANRFYQLFRSIIGKDQSTVWIRLSISMQKDAGKEEENIVRFSSELAPFLKSSFIDHEKKAQETLWHIY